MSVIKTFTFGILLGIVLTALLMYFVPAVDQHRGSERTEDPERGDELRPGGCAATCLTRGGVGEPGEDELAHATFSRCAAAVAVWMSSPARKASIMAWS